ncbi:MAG: tetratricopeptide repeat protein, partial [Chloroflexi bacterium]|nr:tetratricopeptide repeat protein [Chloroflexota bacterium]
VREVIGRRLNRLSQRCNETLTIASVIGREFELRQLNRLIDDATEDMVLDVLEEGLSARVIEELPTAVGRYQFTHALIQETLSAELSLTRRVRLHARIAEMLEELYGDSVEAHAAELAHHFAQAEAMLGTEKLVYYSVIAGERALANYAYEEALAHFQRALASKEDQPVDGELADILFGIGRSQAALALTQDALENFALAFDYYAKTGDIATAVAVASTPVPAYTGYLSGALELCESALELVDRDSLEAGGLFSNKGRILGLQFADYEGAKESFEAALSIAEQHGDQGLEIRILANASFVDVYHVRVTEGLEKCSRIEELTRDVDDPASEAIGHYGASIFSLMVGNLEQCEAQAQASLAPAERARDRSWLSRAYRGNELAHFSRGNWDLAREYNDRALAANPTDARALWSRTLLEYQLAKFEVGEIYLNRLLDAMKQSPAAPTIEHASVAIVTSVVALITNDNGLASVAHDTASVTLKARNVTPLVLLVAHWGLSMWAVLTGDDKKMAELYDIGSTMTQGYFMVLGTRIMGVLAHKLGKYDESVAHFEEALSFCRNGGYRPELAWSLCDYADMLRERNNEGDHDKAVSLLDESLAISTELGMRPLMERVLSRREILKA